MSEGRQEGWHTSALGEATWKAEREEVAARNQQARKAGKARREAYELGRERARRADEERRHAQLLRGREAP